MGLDITAPLGFYIPMQSCTTNLINIPPQSPLEDLAALKQPKPSAKRLALTAFSEADRARFWPKVSKEPHPKGCWVWMGAKSRKGYGLFSLKCLSVKAHRVSFSIHNHVPPDDLSVCHSCDNPSCVNPAHLWLGTSTDNNLDAQKKGRLWRQNWTHCSHGHEFTPENTIIKHGKRNCRACASRRALKFQ